MKPISAIKMSTKRNVYLGDDDNVRYKLNAEYFNNAAKQTKLSKKQVKSNNDDDDDNIRYKLPEVLIKSKPAERKPKPKPKIKINFWSNKQSLRRTHNSEINKEKTNRRHTIAGTTEVTPGTKAKKSTVKVRKRVSFLPSPLFSDNHVPMVTVPDDLTIQLNEDEAHDLGEDLNLAFVNSNNTVKNVKSSEPQKHKGRNSTTLTSPKGTKRKQSTEEPQPRVHGNENELEFFTKYVVQKLRKMETNQRIYSENLINTVLMLGQLGKLNGKSKIADA